MDINSAFGKTAASKDSMEKFLKFLQTEIAMPNIPLPVIDGGVFWIDVVERNGWKLQQNTFSRHARIIRTEDNVRIAWGTLNGMIRSIKRFAELNE